jgi:hypothetical protein
LYNNKKISLEIRPDATGSELKIQFYKEIDDNINKYKTRLIFGGVEIQNDHKLYQHNLKDDFQIQVIKTILN